MKSKHLIIIVAFLVVVILVLALLNRPDADTDKELLSIVINGEVIAAFTMENLQAMPYVEVEKEIVSASNDNESGLWRGVPIVDLLLAADVDTSIYSMVASRATDNYVSAFGMDEILEGTNIFIAYMQDGEPLKTQENGGSGPLRIVIQGDPFGNRSTRWLYQLELQ